ncbi:protein TBRG4 [Heterocephalus glaber]|uniref:FAST kinase domain-containing protein 4 n=1 Tax=Heterocephalus glaber TaxID=10181 RepID=A0AAX6SL47_HETGA|nr:protein TBRG4 [Heterocephalus glaber]XP_004839946.1 protein TBRG4 [Heterocephalus glaber]XP_004839947.1 protein TBRG4 [Heterocephalus glaber]XP_004839948.1 protein TBRG4 [Heterocephalus glaber]XP_021109919.1 protein TBRG4 [Heterocephalus glaber]XP_021109920.1 protein TBRG4 [Heterocephalus glaber]XP_021109922.1 protein TBRG4 [Heterocephalus glaber]
MAVHLVRRYSYLLREAARLAPALAPPCQLRFARVAHNTLTSSATSPNSCSLSSLKDLMEKEPVITPFPEQQEVDRLIEKATRPEELLELLDGGHSLECNRSATILIQLSRLLSQNPQDKALFIQDLRFEQLLHLVNSELSSVWHGTLVKLLRSLYALEVPRTTQALRSVEQEVRWRLRRLKYKHLASLAEACATSSQGQHSQELLAELLVHLERRWTEIEDSHTVVAVMMKAGHLSESLMTRLEDKCLELVDQFGPEELRKVLVTLAARSWRPIPLLRAISYHLVQKPFPLTKAMLLDLAYAYGKLSFHQTQVCQRLAADLLPLMPSLTPGEVARCATSFAFLKWLNLPLFEAFVQHILHRAPDITVPHLCSILLAFARLNFCPEQEDQFFALVHERLGLALASLEPALQVDVVWALCVLQQVQEAELQAVLDPSFHTQFLGARSPKDQNTFQKLLHVNATAQLEHPEYRGPLLPATAVAPTSPGRKVTPLQQELREALQAVLGSADQGSLEVATQYGWVLDAEVLLDADGQFLPPRDYAAPHLAQPALSQPLPPGAKRVSVLLWEFPNFKNKSRDLLGRFVLARRHLQAAGFLLVDVPYYEWLELKSEWQKSAYLKDKMRKAVAEELAK